MTRLISVAMTTCNGSRYVKEQLHSLYRQTLRPAEIVVCDDASDEETLKILRGEAALGKIRLHENPKRLGVLANFQQAVLHCQKGNDIAFCDQDDVWESEKLAQNQILLRAAEIQKPGPALSFSDLALTDEKGNVYADSFWKVLRIKPGEERLQSLLFGNFLTGCTLLMNPEMQTLFLEMPLTSVPMHDAWLGLIAFSFGSYAFSPQPLVRYRQHGENITAATNQTSSAKEKFQENLRQFRKNASYLKPQIDMARCFLKQYHDRLSPKHAQVLHDFVRLEKATWTSKKMLSLLARSYRFHPSLQP